MRNERTCIVETVKQNIQCLHRSGESFGIELPTALVVHAAFIGVFSKIETAWGSSGRRKSLEGIFNNNAVSCNSKLEVKSGRSLNRIDRFLTVLFLSHLQ